KPLFAGELPDPWLWSVYGQALRLSGDEQAYRELRERVQNYVGTVQDKWLAESASRVFALSADPLPDAANLIALAETQRTERPKEDCRPPALALLCYRAGRYEDAVKYLEMQSLSDRPWSGAAAAMIYYRAGRKDEARKWLDRFEAWYEEVPGGAIAGPEYRPP